MLDGYLTGMASAYGLGHCYVHKISQCLRGYAIRVKRVQKSWFGHDFFNTCQAGLAETLIRTRISLGLVLKGRTSNRKLINFFKTNKISQFDYFDSQVKEAATPALIKLVGQGKAKEVYIGYQTVSPSKRTPKVVAAFAKINDIVYIISKNRFHDELKDELRISPKIKNKVYLANLKKFFLSLHQPLAKAKSLTQKLIHQFPAPEILTRAFYAKDPVLREFFVRNSLSSLNWNDPVLRRLLDSCLHLSVDLACSPTILIHGKRAILTKKAECDLEAAIRKRKYPLFQTGNLILQMMRGFRDLHAGGYIHGDLKLENVLVYNFNGKPVVKIADWGKCKAMTAKEVSFHTGNHRHMPPERLSSQKGEVFGIGLMAVRMLEEEFLPGIHDMLLFPDCVDPKKEKTLREEKNQSKSRKGIERFLSIAKECPESDVVLSDVFCHIVGSLKSFVAGSYPNIDAHIEKYLNALHERLEIRYGKSNQAAIAELIDLLKKMLKSNRKERLTMEEAVPKFESILSRIHK